MRKQIKLLALAGLLVLALLLPARLVSSQVGAGELAKCASFGFSTEEDFMAATGQYISDGDLLGPDCALCATNLDLIGRWDIGVDLGLDAVDVIDADSYTVALSTELDSVNWSPTDGPQFTAGDLLITTGTGGLVIPNVALTHKFGVGYDIGLDAVHFVGLKENILGFLKDPETPVARVDWTGDLLVRLLVKYEIDIWFSTEGTFRPPELKGFLDGDLLSARDGAIVAPNQDLLDPSVPAGLQGPGVDFGLDAVTTDRKGDKRRIHFSTEILYRGEVSFTDGDILRMGNGVAVPHYDLISCFKPAADFVGLDALSVNLVTPEECVSRITKVGGVDIADISPATGMANPGTVGSINAPVPFGGLIDIQGQICDNVDEFRIVYRLAGSGNPWTGIPVEAASGWQVKVDAFLPPYPDCLGSQNWYSTSDGWYDGIDYRHLTDPMLGACNPGLALTVWNSGAALPDGNALYEVMLETLTTAGITISGTTHLVQLDNTAPVAELEKTAGECEGFTAADMPLTVTGRISDTHFYAARLQITGNGYGIKDYTTVAYYDDGGDNLIATGTLNWPNYVGLGPVTVYDLDAEPVDCGYTVSLTAWERTLWCHFKFSTNQAYHYPGHRHDTDSWTFNFDGPH
ncbi:MAG: hypothetical protein JXA09_02530 [Anaerolineae bacterium]|nr:hypothetical protein [Anaerolineae bacterium]